MYSPSHLCNERHALARNYVIAFRNYDVKIRLSPSLLAIQCVKYTSFSREWQWNRSLIAIRGVLARSSQYHVVIARSLAIWQQKMSMSSLLAIWQKYTLASYGIKAEWLLKSEATSQRLRVWWAFWPSFFEVWFLNERWKKVEIKELVVR